MLFSDPSDENLSSRQITLWLNGQPLLCEPGQTVAGALLMSGHYLFRRSPNAHSPRGAFCMMGACQECVVHIDGMIRRACQSEVLDGMQVTVSDAKLGGSDDLPNTSVNVASLFPIESEPE